MLWNEQNQKKKFKQFLHQLHNRLNILKACTLYYKNVEL